MLALLNTRFSTHGKIKHESGRGLRGSGTNNVGSRCSRRRTFPRAKKRSSRSANYEGLITDYARAPWTFALFDTTVVIGTYFLHCPSDSVDRCPNLSWLQQVTYNDRKTNEKISSRIHFPRKLACLNAV